MSFVPGDISNIYRIIVFQPPSIVVTAETTMLSIWSLSRTLTSCKVMVRSPFGIRNECISDLQNSIKVVIKVR